MGRLRGRLDKLEVEAEALSLAQKNQLWTPDAFVGWVETGVKVCLEVGWLVDTPSGLKLSDDLDRQSRPASIAGLLVCLPENLGHRGFKYPDDLGAFWESLYQSERECLQTMLAGC